eukprot:5975324-Pleurochrysis_carterae.AAC.1
MAACGADSAIRCRRSQPLETEGRNEPFNTGAAARYSYTKSKAPVLVFPLEIVVRYPCVKAAQTDQLSLGEPTSKTTLSGAATATGGLPSSLNAKPSQASRGGGVYTCARATSSRGEESAFNLSFRHRY